MKNIITKLALLSIVLTLGFGCSESNSIFSSDSSNGNDGNVTDDTYGKLSLNISTITDVTETKSEDDSDSGLLVSLSEFVITIYDSEGENVYTCSYDDVPSVIGLPVGEGYLVTVTGGTDQSAAFDSPYYYGGTEFKIVADYINTVNVESSLANTQISLDLSSSFLISYGDDWQITIRNEEYLQDGDQQLVFTPENQSEIGYIRPSKLYVIVRAGSIEKSYEIDEVSGAEHHTITIDLLQSGSSTFNIYIDETLVEKEVNLTIPSDDETLGDGGVSEPDFVPETDEEEDGNDDVVTAAAPSIYGDGFDMDEVLTFDKNNPTYVVGVIEAEAGIDQLLVTIDSSDDVNFIVAALFGSDYAFDMANPTDDERANLESLNILAEGEDIKGNTSATLDVTGFMMMLDTNGGETHNFTIKVVDENGSSDEKIMRVLVVE